MNILVTGGTGTISSGLVKECVNRGYNVTALTRGRNKARNIEDAEYIYCDIWNINEVKRILSKRVFDVVVECQVYTLDQLKVSIANFSDICNQYIFVSTAGVYNLDYEGRISEIREKNNSSWSYTRNKIACENYLIEYCTKASINYTIIRPTVTYGNYRVPFPIATRSPGWSVFQRMIDGKPMLAGNNVRFSIIHIDDFSNAVVSLFCNEKAFNEDFHIASNQNDVYWDDVLKIAGEILQVDPMIIHVPVEVYSKTFPSVYDELKFNKNCSILLDDEKIKRITGFEARINIEKGMKMIISSMKDEFINNRLKIDVVWNNNCNATIYQAYKKKLLCREEQKALNDYFHCVGINEFRESTRRVKIRLMKDRARTAIAKFNIY